jgi:signal transduction histidine kinase/CheY-like chemotaxis protein
MLNGEDSYFSLALIPGTPWLAMSVLPSQQYNAVPKIFLSFSLILFLTLLFLAGIPAFFLAKSITSPLRKFAWASTAMAKGNFEQRVDAGNDEIGDLAKSFNLMAEKLGAAASREKLMLAAEASARLKAELANHHKNEFIAKISHDLQTPLKTVLDMIKLLEAGDFSGTSQPEVAAIKKAGQDLFQLIDGILDFYRLENGTISLAPVPFDLYAILATLKKKYEPAARAKRITLVYAESEAVPTTVVGDEARIFQILGNLLDNAIKFTEHGEISLRVRPLGLKVINDQHIIHLRFEVTDTGCGISLEQQTAIFDSFKPGESYMSRKADGLGIGLPLCQQLIDLMNGQIGMKSEPGQGSTFFVELNLPVAKEGPLAATLETTAPRAANGPIVQQNLGKVMQVLIAEDNPVARNLLRLMLEMRGHHVRVAENGKEAVAVYQSENLDLILMDIQMPGMNGFEATSAIRELEKHTDKHLPIIAVTAHVMPGYKDECLRAGLDNYLARPFRMQELFGMIDETLAQLNKQA